MRSIITCSALLLTTITSTTSGGSFCYEPHVDTNDPSSLGYYRALYDYLASNDFDRSRGSGAESQRVGSVEVVRAGSLPDGSPIAGPNVDLSLIRISSILAFSDAVVTASATGTEEDGTSTVLVPRGNGGIQAYGDAAGFLLGIHHFNNGIGNVVREIDGINNTCPVRFVVDFADSESSQTVAVENFSRDICAHPDRPPAALFSAWRSAVSIPLAVLSSVYAIPQISPLSTSTELNDVTQYRYFARLIPSDAGTARATIDYLRSRSPSLRHLGVLYVNDAYGSAFFQALSESAQSESTPVGDRINVLGSPFSYNVASYADISPREIRIAIRALADTSIRVFFGVFYDVHYELVMRTAFEFGIAGPGYAWILSDGVSESYLHKRSYPAGSPLAIASQGIGILKAEGGRETVDGNRGYDRFSRAWYGQSDDSIDYYNCVGRPPNNTAGDPSIYYQGGPGLFSREDGGSIAPTAGSVFVYDSVMALGLAACGLLKDGKGQIEGTDLFAAFLRQNFEGASGRVVIDAATHSRDAVSAFFVLYNANGQTVDGVTTFAVNTASHTVAASADTESAAADPDAAAGTSILWVDMNATSFVYADGTATFPPPPEGDKNLIPRGLLIAGYVLFAVAAFAIIVCGVWLYLHRLKRQVKHRQPPLLGLVLLGCLISTSTILALAQESSGDGPVPACMVSPWLYSVGFCLTFATLLAKSWRIKKLFTGAARMERTAVTLKDALLIVGGIVGVDVVILAIWTGVDPLQWTRQIVQSDKYGGMESQGFCSSDYFVLFLSLLAALQFAVLAAGAYFCYVARNIPTTFSEGKFVSLAILSNLQIFLIGLPVLIIVGTDADSSFFVRTGIIWINNMTVIGFVFGNLMYAVHMDNSNVISTRTAIKSYVQNSKHSKHRGSFEPHEDPEHDRTTDLIAAASKGDLETVRVLLSEEPAIERSGTVLKTLADINSGDYDHRTALHLAAGEGHLEICEELCARGADVNVVDRWGGRPLDDAIRCNHEQCAAVLIRYGARSGKRHSMLSLATPTDKGGTEGTTSTTTVTFVSDHNDIIEEGATCEGKSETCRSRKHNGVKEDSG